MLRHLDGPEQEYLTMTEAVKWLGVPAKTLTYWASAGKIPGPKTLRKGVVRYHWRVVVAIAELIACGHLDPQEGDPPET